MRRQIEKLDALLKSIEADVNATKGSAGSINPTAGEIRPALAEALVVSAALMAETAPSPVSHAPCITGTITANGETSEFMIPLENDSVGFSQWGAWNPVLWSRVDLLDNLSGPAREWYIDNKEEKDEGNHE